MDPSRILELAGEISKFTNVIHNHLVARSLPFPSFSPGLATPLPDELAEAQDAILDATSELHDLLMPPVSALHTHGNVQNLVSMNAIRHFGLADSFAPNEQATFAQIAKDAGLGESITRSLLRHAMTMRIFCEPRKGIVAHTARSVLFREKQFLNFISTGFEEITPAALQTINAISKWPGSEEPAQTGFVLANKTSEPIYDVLEKDPVRAKRFADAMSIFTTGKGFEASHVITGFDWRSLGTATVVDIGGSGGHISVALATEFPLLKIIVEDLGSTIESGQSKIPEELWNRVSFLEHDFFTEQKVVADVYYYRWVFHNWSDKYCIKILRSLVPVLRPGVRIIINDVCVPDPGETALWREKEHRTLDLDMIAILNGRERDLDEWKSLFERADPRFHWIGVNQPNGSSLAMIEVSWSA